MTPVHRIIIKANPELTTQAAVRAYISGLQLEFPVLRNYTYALVDVVNEKVDYRIEIYEESDMDGDFVSSTHGTRLLWIPDVGRAALNSFQSGDWQWTDADSPEDALRRYREDDMRP